MGSSMGWRACRTVVALPPLDILGHQCRSSSSAFCSTSLRCLPSSRWTTQNCLGGTRVEWSILSNGIRHRCTSLFEAGSRSDLLMEDQAEKRKESLEEDEFDEELDDDYHGIDEGKEEEYEDDGYWEDVDYPAATELANTLARIKMNQAARVVPEVKKWIRAGNDVTKHTLLFLMRKLRKRNRIIHALQIADWMALQKPVDLDAKDDIRRIDLHGRCGYVQKAERLFNQLPFEYRSEDAYSAILLAYTKAKIIHKSEYIFNKLKSNNMITTAYPFNLMCTLYRRRGLEEKVLVLADEAKDFGIVPDTCFYNNLLAAKYRVEGIEAAQKIFQRIKSSQEKKHITTYVSMAGCYASEGMIEKAEGVLEEIEHFMETGHFPKLRTNYNVLVTMYAALKNPRALRRAWKEMLKLGDPTSQDYIVLIKAWGKIGEVEKAERAFKEAEANSKLQSSPIFNAMLYVYSTMLMTARAEALVKRMEEELSVSLDPWCYYHLVALYVKTGDLEKAISVLRESQVAGNRGFRSRPMPASLATVLNGLAEIPDVQRAEQVFRDWQDAGYRVNIYLYNKLLRVYVNAKKPVHGFVERMLGDNIRPNIHTENLFDELKLNKKMKPQPKPDDELESNAEDNPRAGLDEEPE